MAKPAYTEAQIIQKTLENVRSFYNRKQEVAALPIADDFVWIGPKGFQWSKSREEFIEMARKEQEPSFLLADEEYHLLFHERNVWVVYGRYTVTATMEDGAVFHAPVRGTYVWHMVNGELKLAHVHDSHIQDMSMGQKHTGSAIYPADTDFFEYMKRMDMHRANQEKIVFRDKEKNYHYLFPSDILYLKAAAQYSMVYTKTDSFKTWGLLADIEKKVPETFRRIHKSYLVNTIYIDSVRRYRATLKDGQELPIGKERYMDLKKHLQNGI